MIITRAPFRISFGGGGSDMQSYYQHKGGCVISTSINKYMHITIHPSFEPENTTVKYSLTETVNKLEDIQHPIVRTVLQKANLEGIEINSIADVPAGTGLGSSSTFTVALLNAINAYKGKYVSKEYLASEACRVEIEDLKSPIGKQDQYASAYGGLNFIEFHPNGTVSVEPVIMKPKTYHELQENLLMFYTGAVRSANSILSEQNKNLSSDEEKVLNMDKMCQLARDMRDALQENKLDTFGELLNAGWELKKKMASSISNPDIDTWYNTAMQNGAKGGKLLGAGGGGFLLFYCEKDKQEALRKALPLREMPFMFDNSGSNVIFVGDKYWD